MQPQISRERERATAPAENPFTWRPRAVPYLGSNIKLWDVRVAFEEKLGDFHSVRLNKFPKFIQIKFVFKVNLSIKKNKNPEIYLI